MATLTGQRARSTTPARDTPGAENTRSGGSGSVPRADLAVAAWRSVTPSVAGTPHVRISHDGGRTYPARHARPLPAGPPGQPCTVPVFDPGTGTGRMLALDLDPSRAGRDVDDAAVERGHERRAASAAEVRAQAEALAGLVARRGGQVLADVSPSGGRHVYVLFAAALPWLELRDVARALALRFSSIDTAPMSSLGGQISPPGARHKSGGWRVLLTPPEDAAVVVEHPNGPEVWAALLAELAGELRHVDQPEANGTLPHCEAELDDTGVPWLPRLGGGAPLSTELEQVARSGRWDRSRYAGRSEARMAIVGSAVAGGWRLAEVQSAIACGAWRGLARLYERRSEPGRMERLLPAEWRKCIAGISREKNVRQWHTSNLSTRPPAEWSGGADEFGLIRQWMTAILCAAEDPERVKGWGRRACAVRLVLLALGQAAMVSGSSVVEFGCRNLALHSALSHRTVARVLRLLATEPDPLVDLVSPCRLARADRYALLIPDRYAASVRWRRRRAGRVEAIAPVFLVLGGIAGLVYQVLGLDEVRGAEVARLARLSASATSAALRVLAEHGLAERGPGGWRRGAVALADVAESTGAAALQQERKARYKQDREGWRATLRRYQAARHRPVNERDGWWSLDDPDEYDFMACRWLPRGSHRSRAACMAGERGA